MYRNIPWKSKKAFPTTKGQSLVFGLLVIWYTICILHTYIFIFQTATHIFRRGKDRSECRERSCFSCFTTSSSKCSPYASWDDCLTGQPHDQSHFKSRWYCHTVSLFGRSSKHWFWFWLGSQRGVSFSLLHHVSSILSPGAATVGFKPAHENFPWLGGRALQASAWFRFHLWVKHPTGSLSIRLKEKCLLPGFPVFPLILWY